MLEIIIIIFNLFKVHVTFKIIFDQNSIVIPPKSNGNFKIKRSTF
jgi:hypothetical protein